ncbi:GDYXXLXY domain-containing protein [Sphingobium aromaticiconvertens]|uniref:GDYXXLXY domain-containing protein n=1 Tax=Sphingobium aromaticiconvertens TaxID=365341 RepID=UPI0030177F64
MTRPVPLRTCLAAALLLPLIVLAYTWGATYRLAQQGQDWLVPINGYDPRDLLRGHFVQYRYDWPVNRPSADRRGEVSAALDPTHASRLCIEGVAPNITGVRALPFSEDQVGSQATEGCAIVVHATLGTRREVRGLETGIMFTSQDRAIALSRRLADRNQQGFVRVKIRSDGVMRPVDLEFRPRVNS